MAMRKQPITKDEAMSRLAGLCARSEQCEFDLNRKMVSWGLSAADRKDVIEYLKENRFLDDSRYAASYTGDKAKFSAWGPIKIKMELSKRRINTTLITEALKNIDQQVWKEGLMRCAVSKAKNLDLLGEDGRPNCQKLYRFLIGRGFPSSASSRAVAFMRKSQEENKG